MILGFDYFKTISTHPKETTYIAKAVKLLFCEVYVITAVSQHMTLEEYKYQVEHNLRNIGFPYNKIIYVQFEDQLKIPELKLKACQELGINIFFDDRKDVCEALAKHGIVAFQSTNYFPPKNEAILDKSI